MVLRCREAALTRYQHRGIEVSIYIGSRGSRKAGICGGRFYRGLLSTIVSNSAEVGVKSTAGGSLESRSFVESLWTRDAWNVLYGSSWLWRLVEMSVTIGHDD